MDVTKPPWDQQDYRPAPVHMEQKPSVARIVHYHSYNEKGECAYAAMITQVNPDGTVELATFGPNSLYFQHNVKFSDTPKESHWSWPNRV